MSKILIVGGFRTILEDRKTVKKVLFNKRTKKFNLKENGEPVAENKVCKKQNLILLENGQYKVKRRPKQSNYDDWWQESNLDGSFAYNGVTDDF